MVSIAWSEIYAHPLPEGHRFPMEKYALVPEQLLYEGTITQAQLVASQPLTEAQILTTHDADYWHRLSNLLLTPREQRVSGFPHNEMLILRERIICQGTIDGAVKSIKGDGCALNIAGGTHHAYRDRGEGFCLLNDIALGANHLLNHAFAKRILVVDLDVHQGNGTAVIFQNDPRVFTFSMHGEKNYPFKKEQSDLDIGLPDGIKDDAYLSLLEANFFHLIEQQQPDFIFFQSGVDILETDKLGKLGVSIDGCKQRDEMIIRTCFEKGIPMQISMGGGYSKEIKHIVEAHANTFRLAMHYFG
ncbi:MAG: histone deacetylase [Salibacteraceae bacterium]|nr:histone deacetylase [Salibacteraceae bacterium]